MNATYWYSNFNDCLWLIFQGGFRNSTFLENPSNESNQLVQRSNKYYTCIRALCFWFSMYVCVTFVNTTLQMVFWLSWKNKSGKWLATLCNCVFHFYLQIKIFHQSINQTKFWSSWKERFCLQIHFYVIFWLWAITNSLIVIAHGQKLSA